MSIRAHGRISVGTAGTPVRATNNESDADVRVPCHSIMFQRNVSSETGRVYILKGSTAGFANVIAVLAAPTIGGTHSGILASATFVSHTSPNAFNLAEFYIDVETNNDGCIVSSVRS
jgi:hypothetical protein